jgi:serine/threonine-protein kinase
MAGRRVVILEPSQLRRWILAAVAVAVVLAVSVGVYLLMRGDKNTEKLGGGVKSIAVLPFKPLVATSGDEVLELGIADTLITKLSNVRQIVVRPTGAVLKYTDPQQDLTAVGRELGVDAVLDGSLQRFGDQLRVTVQLVSVRDGALLWTYQCDEPYADLFAVQDAISEQVAQALVEKLTGQEQRRLTKRYTDNTQAYHLYLQGRYFWNKRTVQNLRKAIEHFEQAIRLDPSYALAYAGLADSYVLLNHYSPAPMSDAFPRARDAAQRALRIDNSLAEPHAALGCVKYNYEWDWPGAEIEFQRAIELNPNDATAHQWYGECLMYQGRLDETLVELALAQTLDPLSAVINTQLGAPYQYRRQCDQAMERFRKVLELEPDFGLAFYYMGRCYEQKLMYEEAVSAYRKMSQVSGLAEAGYVYGVWGRPAEARAVLNTLMEMSQQHDISPYLLATVHAGLNEKEPALAQLEEAYQQRDARLVLLKVNAHFDRLRDDPRFQDLLRHIGLAP